MIKQVLGPLVGSIGGEETMDGRVYREEYFVEFEPNTTTRPLDDIYGHDKIPKRGRPYPANPNALCHSIRPEQLDNHKWLYRVQLIYSTVAPNDKDSQKLPWEWPVTSHTEWSERERFQAKDLDGRPFQNTAGSPLVPSPAIQHWEPTVVFNYNVVSFSLWSLDPYAGATNNAPWFNQAAYSWRCVPRGVSEARVESQRYLQVAIGFERWINPETGQGMWHPHKEPNLGFYQRGLGAPGTPGGYPIPGGAPVDGLAATPAAHLEHILDKNGNPVTEPRFLDVNGRAGTDDERVAPNDLSFRVRRLENFSVFDILLRAAGFQ